MATSADVMRYHMASANDLSELTVRKFYLRLVNFNKVHEAQQKFIAAVNGAKFR